jgi:hypothetical protein
VYDWVYFVEIMGKWGLNDSFLGIYTKLDPLK